MLFFLDALACFLTDNSRSWARMFSKMPSSDDCRVPIISSETFMDVIFSFLQFLGKTPRPCLAYYRQLIHLKKRSQEKLVLLFCRGTIDYNVCVFHSSEGAEVGEVPSVKFMHKPEDFSCISGIQMEVWAQQCTTIASAPLTQRQEDLWESLVCQSSWVYELQVQQETLPQK